MTRDKLFGVMGALAIVLNALYVVGNIFLSPFGVQYPFIHFVSGGALILAAFLYGPAAIALALWLASHFGKSHAQD